MSHKAAEKTEVIVPVEQRINVPAEALWLSAGCFHEKRVGRRSSERRVAENALSEQLRSLQAEVATSRSSQSELQRRLSQLGLFERQTSELFWIMDLRGNFTYMSPAVEYLWGYTVEEIMGLSMADVLTPASLAIAIDANRRAFAEIVAGHPPKRFRAELEHLCKDGSIVWAEINVNYIFDEAGAFMEKRGITRDITERKRHELLLEDACMAAESVKQALEEEVAMRRSAEELLMMHQRELELLNRELELRVASEVLLNRRKDQALMQSEKMALVGQLAAGVAHEINNPMCFVSGNLRILGDYLQKVGRFDRFVHMVGEDDVFSNCRELIARERAAMGIEHILADGIDLIEESLGGAERITKIVRDLKHYSRVDCREEEWVTLDSCVESALNLCSNELNSVAFIRKGYETVPALLCHYGQLNQLFMNLLLNAAEAITQPGVIAISCWHDELSVYASISDTGCGMPQEVRARIFEPFFTTKAVGKGTGLGLSVSYEIIQRHHGELLVSSTVGVGTTFTVVLPKAVGIRR